MARYLTLCIGILGATAIMLGTLQVLRFVPYPAQAANVVTTSVRVLPRESPGSRGPELTKTATGTARILFAGDIMPSRFVATRMRTRGYDSPFAATTELLGSADLAFANLEAPIVDGRMIEAGEMAFRGDPAFLPAMRAAGIDVVSLANNHSPNFGERGLGETMRFLNNANIAHVGAGTSSTAYAALYVELYESRVAFVAQNDNDVVPPEYCAGESRVGTACYDIAQAKNEIARARTNADIVIFTMHSGTEYTAKPNPRQAALAHAAIDAGADIVIGHHPHVVQTVEEYKGKRIYYSLGNFIFDQHWSMPTRLGLVVVMEVDRATKKIAGFEHRVVRIDDYHRPMTATADEAKTTLARLGM